MPQLLFALTRVVTPLLIVWGWVRFIRYGRARDRTSSLSLAALILATCSCLWAIGSVIYAGAAGGFEYYDPRLVRIIRVGLSLSSFAMIAGLIGLVFRNPVRWQASVASLCTLILWCFAASGE